MKIILGLGNPGNEYLDTRHNVGFLLIDKINEKYSFPEFTFKKNFNAEVSKGRLGNTEILLVKPQTFMNNSGAATQAVLNFYKLSADDLLILQDELDIELGKYKLATDSSSAGHNGVQDIIEKISTQKFRRLRIGIGQQTATDESPGCRLGAHTFVLGKFSPAELESLEKIAEPIFTEVEKFATT